jgi:hypothetical protein
MRGGRRSGDGDRRPPLLASVAAQLPPPPVLLLLGEIGREKRERERVRVSQVMATGNGEAAVVEKKEGDALD